MTAQSSRHILMMEPASAGFNPQTAPTNDYQIDNHEDQALVLERYIREFRGYRDALIEAGVFVTTVKGPEGCLDAVFPNWFSMHDNGMIVYPMLTPNRNAERMPSLIAMISNRYGYHLPPGWADGKGTLEGDSALVLDRINKIAYASRSARADDALAREWAELMGFELVMFDTLDHRGKPVYHTDLVMWIGSGMVGVCSECIAEKDRARVLESLRAHREVIEFDNHQLRNFCGNALEMLGHGDKPVLAMSKQAVAVLKGDQRARIDAYYGRIVPADIPTIEAYGGGSARCMLQEIF